MPDRKLTTIMSADVVGYSRLMSEDEEGTLRRLADMRTVVDRLIAEHRGRIFGNAGDSVIAEFASPVKAVRCALDIQRGLAAINAGREDSRRMLLRIGINLGDVLVEDDNLFGDGVNIAARLQEIGPPGGVCISANVFDQVSGKSEDRWRSMGPQRLKNMPTPVRAYCHTPDGLPGSGSRPARFRRPRRAAVAAAVLALAAAGAALFFLYPGSWIPGTGEPSRVLPLANRTTIAVLPFAELSGQAERRYLGTGITEGLIMALGRFPDLAVIAHDAVAPYDSSDFDVAKAPRALGAQYLVKGVVQTAGERVRVTTQLIDAERGVHLWSKGYNAESGDLFAVQDEIVRSITASLAGEISDLERQRAVAKPTTSLAAYDYYLKGMYQLSLETAEANAEARRMFEAALALDPGFSAALSGLGWHHYYEVTRGWTEFVADSLRAAEDSARRALRLDPDNVDAHRLLGVVHLYRKEYDQAIDELKRALRLNPSDALSYARYGAVLLWSGKAEQARGSLETALRFNPRMSAHNVSFLGFAYYLTGDYDRAIGLLRRNAVRHPEHLFSRIALAAAYAKRGEAVAAAREADTVRRLWPFFAVGDFVSQFRSADARQRLSEGLRAAGLK